VERAARPFTEPAAPVHRQPVDVHVAAHEGAPLELTWRLVEQPRLAVTVRSPEPLGAARSRAASEEYLREQLGRLGATAYSLNRLTLELSGMPFVPSSLLNNLRREATDALAELQGRPGSIRVNDPVAVLEEALRGQGEGDTRPLPSERSGRVSVPPQLHILVRKPEQLDAALALDPAPASITLDYLELYGLRPAVERVQAAGITARVASPRVLKPDEQRVVRFLLKLGCEIVVRSSGLLEALQHEQRPPLIGDFSLNAANTLSADLFFELGLARLTPGFDLNAAQVGELAQTVGADKIEAVAYQHLPVFHTEHCVFCRFLSTGTSYKDCGHPCETHQVALRDEHGREHPVMADVGCRNTVFGAEAQEASRHLDAWRAAGITHYRLEFVHETAADVERVCRAFQDYLAERISAAQLTAQLQRVAPQGTTEGSLFVPANFEVIPLMQ
jgi:putative protease